MTWARHRINTLLARHPGGQPAGRHTCRKIRQAIGRIIRSETDRGIALILDRRAQHFRADIPGLRMTADPLAEIHSFWRNAGNEKR